MSNYAQKNYNEIQGIKGKYRINQIGCLLTSMCNLLARKGVNVNPLQLNAFFRDHGIYVDVDDGIRDDLYWGAVSRYKSTLVVTGTGSGRPSSNDAIVKFVYQSHGKTATHFSLVVDHVKGLILDSYDGVVKSWNVYGGPKSWASYALRKPAAVKPRPVEVKPQPVTPAPVPALVTYQVFDKPKRMLVNKASGADKWAFGNAKEWKDFVSVGKLKQGQIFEAVGQATHKLGGIYLMDSAAIGDFKTSHKVTQAIGINKVDLTDAPAVPTPVVADTKTPLPATITPDDADTIPVKVVPTDPLAYQKTFEAEEKDYVAISDAEVKDFEGLQPVITLKKDLIVHSGGTFEKDGKTYIRTVKSVENDWWYGVPEEALETEAEHELFSLPLDLQDEAKTAMHTKNSRDKLVGFVGTIQGYWEKFLQAFKLKKDTNKE